MDRPSLADLIVTCVRDPPTNKLRPATSRVGSNNATPDRIKLESAAVRNFNARRRINTLCTQDIFMITWDIALFRIKLNTLLDITIEHAI